GITTQYPNSWVVDLPSISGGSTLGSPSCTQEWDLNIPNAITGASSSTSAPSPGDVACGWTASSIVDYWHDIAIEIMASASSTTTTTSSTATATSSTTTSTPSMTISPNPASVAEGGALVLTGTLSDTSGAQSSPSGTVSWSDGGKGGSFNPSTCTL